MKLTAEEFIDEVNGHNSWQHYPPSKQKVIGWLKQFAEMQAEAINYTRCCMGEAEQLCECKNTEPEIDGWVRCKDCGDVFMV
jgi:hypothetical protein